LKGEVPMFLTPSFSTYTANNPGFATVEMTDKVWNLTTHHIDLYKVFETGVPEFNTFKYSSIGINEISKADLSNAFSKIWSEPAYLDDYLTFMMGYTLDWA